MPEDFLFGLETEYLLSDQRHHRALWYQQTAFRDLHDLLLKVSLDDIPDLKGLESEPAHEKILPFVVEGYHLKDKFNTAFDMHPKGVEIRSPVCQSIEQCLAVQKILYDRLSAVLATREWQMTLLSHHPIATSYAGPQADRPVHFWKWAQRAMTTYGPDINISWHHPQGKKLFSYKKDFEHKLNYYSPALVAATCMSPIFNKELFLVDKVPVRSVRTYYRCEVAPLIEWHESENNRMEFKFFDVALSWEEYKIYFYLCLTIMLSSELNQRSNIDECVRALKHAATYGLTSAEMQQRLDDIISAGEKILPQMGFSNSPFSLIKNRLNSRKCPADFLIEKLQNGIQLDDLLPHLIHYEKENDWIKVFENIGFFGQHSMMKQDYHLF